MITNGIKKNLDSTKSGQQGHDPRSGMLTVSGGKVSARLTSAQHRDLESVANGHPRCRDTGCGQFSFHRM